MDEGTIRTLGGSTAAEIAGKEQLSASLRAARIPDGELLDNLGLFLTRQTLSRINFMQQIYQLIVPVHGVVMEFGVRWGQNMALFSALGNDLGYENVFAEQLATLADAGDVVIAISASGNSPNVLKAIAAAQARGATTIGMSGYAGGKLAGLVHHPIVVENDCIEQVEDIHLILEHMITTGLRARMRAAATEAKKESETAATRHA